MALEGQELLRDISPAFVDVSELCEELSGSIFMISTPGGLQLAVRPETALATKIIAAKEALSGPRADEQRAAIDREVKWGHLEKFKTYVLLPISDKPDDEAIIGLKLILAEKSGAANEFLKAKARLVARGDQQVEGRDYGARGMSVKGVHCAGGGRARARARTFDARVQCACPYVRCKQTPARAYPIFSDPTCLCRSVYRQTAQPLCALPKSKEGTDLLSVPGTCVGS